MTLLLPFITTKLLRPCFAAALLLLLSGTITAQTTLTSRVTVGTDDMEEVITTGSVDNGSSDIEMTSEGAGIQIIGLRFTGLNIPQGAAITSAKIQFTVDEVNSEATILTFRAEATDNSVTFGTTAGAVNARPTTTASVNWTVNAWNTLQERGADQLTPELRTIFQEVVNRSGWASGNAISVLITGTGKRVAESYEGATSGSAGHDATQAATLTITYVMPTNVSVRVNASSDDAEENITTGAIDMTSSDLELTEDGSPVFQQYIGMRFASLNIPKGAIITQAYVQFATDELFSGTTNLTIHGQAADNAATFATTTNNISSRAITAANATWSPAPWTVLQEASALQRTPELSGIIQEIVNRTGWNSGNALVVRISGTGRRTAEAFDGSASEAPLLVVKYYTTTPQIAPIGTFPVPKAAVWKYWDQGTEPGTNWTAPNFNDTTWPFGPAQLGYGDNDEATVVSFGPNSSNKYIATYFRHTFTVANTSNFDSLKISLMRDDGATVYLNGVEVVRSNMPAGAATYSTTAASTVGGTDESKYFEFTISKQLLIVGQNVLAVEVHQDAATSSDISFALSLDPKKADAKVITTKSTWEYKDDGVQPEPTWFQNSFTDASWKIGASPLGYGNADEKTTVSYGFNAATKIMGAYFRKTFTVADTSGYKSVVLRFRADDGATFYLNGAELFRWNMPGGPLSITTAANTWIEGYQEKEWQTYYIPVTLLRPGSNLIAAEIHQNAPTSTDLAFDVEMTISEATATFSTLGKGSVAQCNPQYPGLIGCFTSVTPTAQVPAFIYPWQTHTFQLLMKSGTDRYTGTTTVIPAGNDFTGFISRNKLSTEGWLSVNHENNPGGVSMLDLQYNSSNGLWQVDRIRPVDFTALVKTERNCSGGITPWGTIITSEETYTTGDANSDGWTDVGWNIEIDPFSGQIVDQNRDGKPDKLWAVGRMSHENVVVSEDRRTLYQGEDGGTGCVYKFVAAVPGRLDSGDLYVLKRDGTTATTGTWIKVPNSTKSEQNTVATVAGALGGTRWGGVEDVEINPVNGMIYFTEKGRGDTWRFRDNGTTVSNLEVFISNINLQIAHDAGTSTEAWGVGNDNLAFDAEGNLWVMQDGGRNHMWMISKDHTPATPKVQLFATTPAGGEPTGITFSPDHRFMFLSFQHPATTNAVSQKDVTGKDVTFNNSATIVIARRENLGVGTRVPVVDLGRDITVCVGTPVTLKYANLDALNIWSDGSNDSLLRVTQSGQYHVTAIDNNGRIARDTVNVTFLNPPTVSLGSDKALCPGTGTTITLDPSLGYKWNDGSFESTRTLTKPGRYIVEASNIAGCSTFDTLMITAAPVPQPNLGEDRTVCPGESVILNPGADYTGYEWDNGSVFPTRTVNKPGKYWVRVANASGCISYDTITIKNGLLADLGPDVEICEDGGTAVLNPGRTFSSYAWNTGATTPTITISNVGTYWVEATDEAGCPTRDTIVVKAAPTPDVYLGRDTNICENCTVVLDAGAGFASYRWSTGATTQMIEAKSAGNYGVYVTNSKGCSDYDEINVTTGSISGVDEYIRNERVAFRAYPNPFTNEMKIDLRIATRSNVQVGLFDVAGKQVGTIFEGMLEAGNRELKFDATVLESRGAFIIKVIADGQQLSRMVVRK